ncbi:MAG TPA: hypothetical protein VF516_43700 [Kofleriaceae bacterium]
MKDAALVRRRHGLGDVLSDRQRLARRERPRAQTRREVLTVEPLRDQIRLSQERHRMVEVANDVGMVELGEHAGLALEARRVQI